MMHGGFVDGRPWDEMGGPGVLNRQLLELSEVFDAEAALLRSLAAALSHQRTGVAGADATLLDGATGVVVRLVEEVESVRRRRRHLMRALAGDEGADLKRLQRRTRRPLPPELTRARDSLTVAAREAYSQLAVNRCVLQRAMEQGDIRLRTILAGLDGGATGYAAPDGRGGDLPPPSLLCDEVA